MFLISRADTDYLTRVESADDIASIVRCAPPGRYHIDEVYSTPLPSGCTARKWGTAIRRTDGSVSLERDPRGE
jgi:hypothetical protein